MAGEFDTVETTISVGRPRAPYEQSSDDQSTDALRKDSVWSMALTGLAFQKPTEPSTTAKDAELTGPTLEQRHKFVEQLEHHTKEQGYRSNVELLGMGTTVAGLAVLRASTPLGLTVAALGIGTSLYNGLKADSAHGSARDVLKQMPKDDSERFGRYESDVSDARETSARGYILGGGVALISMSKITPFVNPNTTGAFLLGSIANNFYQTQYSIPKTLSTFRTDVETWKQEQTKK